MTHAEIRERMILSLDGQLSTEESGVVARHLEDCANCRKELELLASAWTTPPSPVSAPPRLWAGVRAKIEADGQTVGLVESASRWIHDLAQPAFLALTVVVGILLGSYLGNLAEPVAVEAVSQAETRQVDEVLNAFYPETLDSVSPEMVELADLEVEYVSR